MPDDPGQELVKAAAAGGVEGFLRTIAPVVVEGGGWAGDVIRWFRFKSQVKMLKRAEALCEEAGISPRAIPLKTFVPLLEYASLEDDPEAAEDPEAAAAMQERWAAMLANAASGDAGPDVLPSFPAILAELTPADASMLARLAQDEHPVDREHLLEALGIPVGAPGTEGRARERALIHVENLRRLGLCDVEPPPGGQAAPFGTFYQMGERYWTNVEITRFGRAFLAACGPPAASGDG